MSPRNTLAASLVTGLSFLIAPSTALAGMSCDDIMNMVDHNVPAAIVVDTIASSGSRFDDATIQCLQDRGAPAEVVAKAQELIVQAAPPPVSDDVDPLAEDEGPSARDRFNAEETLGAGEDLFDDGEDDAAGAAYGADDLEAAIRDYKAKNYRTASYNLFKLLEENAYPEKDSTIKYYLAKSLHALEMYHSAQFYYMEVVRKGPRNPLFKHALPRLAQIANYTGNDYELLRIVGKIAPEAYPRQARPHLYYLMGRKSFEADELSDAAAFFEKVPTSHELYPRAQYFQGQINYQRQKLQSAAKSYREVIRAEPITEDEQLQEELNDLKELALINIARIYYSLERFDNADKYYARVKRESEYWPQSLFERAWTNFFLNDLNATLGLLMTVDSPYYADQTFLPDTQYLRALAYFQFCEYTEVERIVKLFQAKYQPIRNEMKTFIEAYRSQAGQQSFDKAFDSYFGANADDSAIPKAAFKKMLRNRDLASLVRHMRIMEEELQRFDAQPAVWRDTVGEHLAKVIARDNQRYKERAGRTFLQEMLETYRGVEELLQDADVLLFEVADAQRADYVYKARNPEVNAIDEKPIDFATATDIIYWPFNGEFWADELAYYRFTERGSCN